MTMTVKIDGYPDRLACEQCGCELGAKRDGEPWRIALPDQDHAAFGPGSGFNTWTHVLDVDEPPVHLDLTDGCPCHDTYLRLLANRYDGA